MRSMPHLGVTTDRPVFTDILCVSDGSAGAAEATRQACVLARGGGRLEVVSVAPQHAAGTPHPQPRQIEALVHARWLASEVGVPVEAHIVEAPGEAAALEARYAGHDLVVLPPGDGTAAVLAAASIPVLVARPVQGAAFPDSVLIAVDGTPAAHEAARLGARIAADHHALVAIVATPDHDEPHRRALQHDLAAVRQITGSDTLILDEQAPPLPAILRAASSCGASLIVLGSRPGAPCDSVSAKVAALAGCSVLVRRPGHQPAANY